MMWDLSKLVRELKPKEAAQFVSQLGSAATRRERASRRWCLLVPYYRNAAASFHVSITKCSLGYFSPNLPSHFRDTNGLSCCPADTTLHSAVFRTLQCVST